MDAFGRLQVKGAHLINQLGKQVQLRGVATHSLQRFYKFYGDGLALEAAANQWDVDVIRLTLYLFEVGYPNYYLSEAKAFFAAMAAMYAGLLNVLWEIGNEPSSERPHGRFLSP